MYLSNVEKEVLWLTGYGDVPPLAVEQGLEQALERGTYIPGEESLRLRLADALELEERLATAGGKTTEQQAQEAAATVDPDAAVNEHLAAYWPELTQEAAATEDATTEGEEGEEEPPADQWRSPLEIVQEGATEPAQEAPDELDATPAAMAQRIEDQDFSSLTKAQLLAFASTFGVQLKRTDSKDELIATVQRLVDEANEKAV